MLPANPLRQNYERNLLKNSPVKLTKRRRQAIERGIREACSIKKWRLWAFNIRTNMFMLWYQQTAIQEEF